MESYKIGVYAMTNKIKTKTKIVEIGFYNKETKEVTIHFVNRIKFFDDKFYYFNIFIYDEDNFGIKNEDVDFFDKLEYYEKRKILLAVRRMFINNMLD
jgi:hypothetical protein